MQSLKIQNDKLRLIEKIIQSDDVAIIEYMNSFFTEGDSVYQLSEEQKLILEETTEKYYSGEEPSFTWEEIKINARKSYNEKKS